ncbi:IclR family transcriptional regulator [Geomicrobium sp. JCM 19038]|uniref:IclR family transcriptional regulator n=1 Tax=Geomicrobium sp. JCM 19038 TaxID=1460635 RepID=UPI00045F44BC|nr:IclR family transcriptional regulator [Geomicrobium sp. JCM 19038]GAK07070.1 transcriptional regulator, IclR family [Geomicrobium sp. JCM 19038]
MPIIQSVDRALGILDLFNEFDSELKITEISKRLNLHKSTVHSLLKTLEKHDYIEQNVENGKYRLGLKLFERGNYVIASRDIRTMAKDHLYELSKETGQTVHLVIQDGQEGVYIDKVEGAGATVFYSRIGRRIPLHCSGVGKALIAFQADDEIAKTLEGYSYIKRTENTITEQNSFMNEIERIRQKGYAEDVQENEPGIHCVAIPIRNHNGHVIAAISISMSAMKITEDIIAQFVQLLTNTSNKLSAELGYEY